MKIAIYRSDKDDLREKIFQILKASPTPYPIPTPWATVAADDIVELLERERVWDHVVED